MTNSAHDLGFGFLFLTSYFSYDDALDFLIELDIDFFFFVYAVVVNGNEEELNLSH
jgi:hypothetical protein